MRKIKGVSVIIPTIDSLDYICKTIEKTLYILDVMTDISPVKDYEVIISLQEKDIYVLMKIYNKITEYVKQLSKHHRKRIIINWVKIEKGKGIAIHEAMKEAKYEWVAFMDDDFDYKPTWIVGAIGQNYKEMISNEIQLIIPTRRTENRGIKRIILSKVYNFMVKTMFPSIIYIKDFQAGIKIINKKTYLNYFNEDLDDCEKRYVFDTILIHKFNKFGCKIVQRPINYKGKSEKGRSVNNMMKQMIKDLIQYRVKQWMKI